MKTTISSFKSIIAILLTAVLVTSVFSTNVFSAGIDYDEPVLTSAAEAKLADEEAPSDYVENGPSPGGTPFDEDVQATITNEIFALKRTANDVDTYTASVYDSGQDKTNRVASQTSVLNTRMAFCDAVAFDPNHTGKTEFGALLYFYKPTETPTPDFNLELRLSIVKLDTMEILATKSYFTETKLATIDYEIQSSYYSIHVASFNGKYDDILVVNYQSSKLTAVTNAVDIISYSNKQINVLKQLNVANYIQNIKAYDYLSDCSHFRNRPAIRISIGDYDRDSKDELSMVCTATCSHTPYQHKVQGPSGEVAGYAPTDFTTEVAIIDDVLGEAKSVYDDFIYSATSSDNNYDYFNMLYAGNCASGDVDGDACEDVIVAGYWANMGVAKNRTSYTNAYAFNERNDGYGMVVIQFNGTGYIKSNVFTSKLNANMQQGYFHDSDYAFFVPVAIETAAMSGQNKPCTIFLNGDLFLYKFNEMPKVYTFKHFTAAPICHEHDCVRVVCKGNFSKDPYGRESFCFVVFNYARSGGYRWTTYSEFVGVISPNFSGTGQEVSSYTDNSDSFCDQSGYRFDHSYSWENQCRGCMNCYILFGGDIHDDGMKVKYVGTEYIYTDPQVIAVLQAAPYFKELGNWNTFMGQTSYTITTSYGKTTAGSKSWSTDVGAVEDSEAGFIVDVQQHLSIGYTHSNTESWGKTYTSTNTSTFTACAEDTVLIRRIPIQLYAYQVWDNEKGDWKKNPDGSMCYSVVTTRLQPTFYQMKLDQYNEYAEQYNEVVKNRPTAVKLKLIHSKADQDITKYVCALPINCTGNPCNYNTTAPAGTTYLSDHAYALDTGAGSTTSSHDEVTTTTEGHSWSNGLHVNFSIEFGGSFHFFGANAKLVAGPYIDYNRSWEKSEEDSKSNGYGGSGTVCNIDLTNYKEENQTVVSKYTFSWRFAAWKTCLTSDNKEIPVYGYVLNMVTYPGQSPCEVYAEVGRTGKNVEITWQRPIDKGGSPTSRTCYKIYRQLESETDLSEIGEVDTNTFKFSDPYNNLAKGKIYVYYVGCEYEGVRETYSAISFKGSRVIGGIGLKYTVDYNFNGGEGTPQQQIKAEGDHVHLLGAITKKQTAEPDRKVTYNADGGTAQRESDVSTGTSSYKFVKWIATDKTEYNAESIYTKDEDTVMTAKWDTTTAYTEVTLPSATKPGFKLLGWYNQKDQKIGDAGNTFIPAAAETLLAKWEKNTALLTWDLDGGSILSQAGTYTEAGEVQIGSELIAPKLFKKGFWFLGWTPEVAKNMPSTDVTYKASWDKLTYGDIDGNNEVNATDALITLFASTEKVKVSERQKVTADVCVDGKLDAADGLAILQFSVGRISKLPIE